MITIFSNAERAEVLTAALPYIKKYSGKIVVIKYGGNAMINEGLKQQVMEDIVLLWLIGVKVVLVHGGGPEISETMQKLGKEAVFIDGLRVTDKETVDIVQMVLAGKINKTLVNLIQMKGGHAVGLSGIDGGILEAKVKTSVWAMSARSPRSVPSPSPTCWRRTTSPSFPPWPATARAILTTSTAIPPRPTLRARCMRSV